MSSPKPSPQGVSSYQRAYKACFNCRKRKVRCIFDESQSGPSVCLRCRRENKECIVPSGTKRGGIQNVLAGREKRRKEQAAREQQQHMDQSQNLSPATGSDISVDHPSHQHGSHPSNHTGTPVSQHHISPHMGPYMGLHAGPGQGPGMGQLGQLGPGPGGPGGPGGPSGPGSQLGSQLGGQLGPGSGPGSGSGQSQGPGPGQGPGGPQMQPLNQPPHPPQRLPLNPAKSEGWRDRELYNTNDALFILSQVARSFPKVNGRSVSSEPELEDMMGELDQQHKASVPPGNSVALKDVDVIQRLKILTVEDARILVGFFSEHMLAFFPYVPPDYRTAENIAGLPLFLATVCCLAARYYVQHGSKNDLRTRALKIHIDLWEYAQRVLTAKIWSDPASRSVSTVLSLLLLTEWSTVVVHARTNDYDTIAEKCARAPEAIVQANTPRSSDRVGWLLSCQAIRIAQDINVSESSTPIFLAIHHAETVLSARLGRPSMLPDFVQNPLPSTLHFSMAQRAQAEILQIMAAASQTFYTSRELTRELVASGRYVPMLAMFIPHFDNWYAKYGSLFRGEIAPAIETILFGMYHVKLYVFSLSLSSRQRTGPNAPVPLRQLAMDTQTAQLVGLAIDSAKQLIGIASEVFRRGQLAFLPNRWAMSIIHAIVFLIKTLWMNPPIYSREAASETIALARHAATMLLESGPDNLHSCRLYGSVLVNLLTHIARERAQNSNDGSASSSAPGSPGKEPKRPKKAAHVPQAEVVSLQMQQPPQQQQQPHSQQQQQQPDQSSIPAGYEGPVPTSSAARGYVENMVYQGQQQPMSAYGNTPQTTPFSNSPDQKPDPSQMSPHPGASVSSMPGSYAPGIENDPQPFGNFNMSSIDPDPLGGLGNNMDLDFMYSGGDGLSFVEPFLENISRSDFLDNA